MSGIENSESANNQDIAPITAEELASTPDVETEPLDDGQGIEAGSPEVEEPTAPGEGSKPTRGQPKDYEGLRKVYTEGQQELNTVKKQVEFYRSMLQDPEIAPVVKAKLAALERGERFVSAATPQASAPAQSNAPGIDELPDYTQMHPNEVIKDIYNRVYAKVKADVEQTFGEQVQPEIQRIKQEKAEAIIEGFFQEIPDARPFRNELALIMRTRNVNLKDAWKIFDYDNAPERAQKKFEQDIKLKRDANVIQSSSGTPGLKTTGKNPTAAQVIENTLDRLGVK